MTKRRADPSSTGRTRTARETDLRRRPGVREQRKTVLAVTNGESTERAYLEALRLEPWLRQRLVVVVEKGSPVDAVRAAARRRDDNDFDQAYVVCDVDQYPVAPPTNEARTHDVSLLWSNPCFEVWLILHHVGCSHLDNARKARDLLRRHVKDWDKTKLRFDDFREGVTDAVGRAQKLGAPPDANPSTGVWQLVDALR
ncbi:RloB family protein [Micromonospora sp. WMMD882]|uniref:RloB family protein n=1 Tax=Micromonospora sp. WMMD882 TaxID=3015151 RepID=UPI00248AD8BB|nr:RloB family protein [Micromonospora sp. WMMD882]WBB82022.1 RloB family protein [Micromonospora sp. WMMD882]